MNKTQGNYTGISEAKTNIYILSCQYLFYYTNSQIIAIFHMPFPKSILN